MANRRIVLLSNPRQANWAPKRLPRPPRGSQRPAPAPQHPRPRPDPNPPAPRARRPSPPPLPQPTSPGEKGRRIRELTSVVQKRFNFPPETVELYAEKVANRGLCAVAQAESLRYKLLGGLAVRRCVWFGARGGAQAAQRGADATLGAARAARTWCKAAAAAALSQQDGAMWCVYPQQAAGSWRVFVQTRRRRGGAAACRPRPRGARGGQRRRQAALLAAAAAGQPGAGAAAGAAAMRAEAARHQDWPQEGQRSRQQPGAAARAGLHSA
jgi:hypothetical protein